MDNAWGIVRCIIDLVMQQKDGKVSQNSQLNEEFDLYTLVEFIFSFNMRLIPTNIINLNIFQYLIVKDPNKPVLRLYDIPDNTFESDEDSDEDDDVEGKSCVMSIHY